MFPFNFKALSFSFSELSMPVADSMEVVPIATVPVASFFRASLLFVLFIGFSEIESYEFHAFTAATCLWAAYDFLLAI